MISPGDIISYLEMCSEEHVNLQRGMNYKLGSNYSVILMSVRNNAPYSDEILDNGQTIIYEGHDIPKQLNGPEPKTQNQPKYTDSGKLTQNGLFFQAAKKNTKEHVRVYEKIKTGIWAYNVFFELNDAWIVNCNNRDVFKFKLTIIDKVKIYNDKTTEICHTRIIPQSIKLAVWKRDKGRCCICGSTDNLHFDHIIPFSKGGTSLDKKNIQLLCARHNLLKKDNIE